MEPGAAPDPRRWRALALVCVAFFMVILDVAIVNVALPSIQEDLGISRDTLQWIVTAYSLAFGGFLLLGGRAADLLGRRRVFMVGMVLFTGGSLACGFADSGTQLIVFRALQGLGGAIVSPATLAIISDSFRHDQAERNKAFGIWGAVAGSGAAAGVLLGGILVEYLGWEWIFFVNVPVGVAIFALAPTLISEGRVEGADRRVDVLGALLVTSGLVIFVYAMSEAPDAGWGSAQTLGLTALSVALVAAFFWWEARTPSPIVPLGLFRIRPVFVANTIGVLLGATLFGGFFLLTLYMQTVLGYSALEAGLAFLATAGMTIPGAAIAQAVVTRAGVKPVMMTGTAFLAFAYLWYTQLPVDGTFWVNLFVPFVISGFGLAFIFIPMSLAALSRVEDRIAGVASGLLNTSQQLGGAVGVALISTISNERADTLAAEGDDPLTALTGGYNAGFAVASVFALLAVGVAWGVLRRDDVPAAALQQHAPGPDVQSRWIGPNVSMPGSENGPSTPSFSAARVARSSSTITAYRSWSGSMLTTPKSVSIWSASTPSFSWTAGSDTSSGSSLTVIKTLDTRLTVARQRFFARRAELADLRCRAEVGRGSIATIAAGSSSPQP